MKIELLHYEVNRKWGMHNSYRHGVADNVRDLVLRDAISVYFNFFAFGSKPKGIDFGGEDTFQRSDMLSTLLLDLSIPVGAVHDDGSYPFELPANFGSMHEAYIETDCGRFDLHTYKHQQKNDTLRDFHTRPSKRFKRAVGFLRDGFLYVHLPTDVTATTMMLYYYKVPNEVCIGTYPEIPEVGQAVGSNLPKVECDLPEKYHYLVVDIAVAELCRTYGDLNRLNLSNDKIFST